MGDPLLGRHVRSNPAAQARPRRPRPYQSESVKALPDDEMNRLPAAVKAQAIFYGSKAHSCWAKLRCV